MSTGAQLNLPSTTSAATDPNVAELNLLAARGLVAMFDADRRLFCNRLVCTERGLVREGVSPRYTIMTLLGLRELQAAGGHSPVDAKAIYDSFVRDTSWIRGAGDFGLLVWLTAAFSRYTISMYANRFNDYGGERFEVSPAASANPNGVIVSSRLVKTNGEAVALNYLLRQDASGAWKVIDVYLSGTVSELATRRSEFAAVLQRSGADGLVEMIEQRSAALRTG